MTNRNMKTNNITTLSQLIDHYNAEIFTAIPLSAQYPYKSLSRYVSSFLAETYLIRDMNLTEVTNKVFIDFDFYLRSRNFSNRTVHRQKRLLEKILHSVDDNGKLAGGIAVRQYSVKHEYLTKEELIKIISVNLPCVRLKKVRDLFIFSCFSGLRHDDIMEMTETNLSTCEDGHRCLVFVRRLTNTTIRIPLLDIPQKIIDKYWNMRDETLLPMITSAKANYYLKEIAKICGIAKPLTLSMARNTFASTVTLANGLSLDVISEMMGHDIQSTIEGMATTRNVKIERNFINLTEKITDFNSMFVL